jgi:hypothetical protein
MGWQSSVWVLAKWGSHDVYNTIPKSRKWLIVNCVVNVTRIVFHIFKSSKIWKDYMKLCRPKTSMAMQKRTWTTTYLFNQCCFLLTYLYYVGFLEKIFWYIVYFDSRQPWVTWYIIKTIKQVTTFGLDMVNLPFHISHVLQPLHVTYFKPFKNALKKEWDFAMVNNSYFESIECLLTMFCNSFWKEKKIKLKFKVTFIWILACKFKLQFVIILNTWRPQFRRAFFFLVTILVDILS